MGGSDGPIRRNQRRPTSIEVSHPTPRMPLRILAAYDSIDTGIRVRGRRVGVSGMASNHDGLSDRSECDPFWELKLLYIKHVRSF